MKIRKVFYNGFGTVKSLCIVSMCTFNQLQPANLQLNGVLHISQGSTLYEDTSPLFAVSRGMCEMLYLILTRWKGRFFERPMKVAICLC